jgi:GH15 family glucan-1,4-alpha-glucosidase
MMQPDISSLALISDRNTCAILDKEGTINWYCPVAFDQPAIFAFLINEEQGGFWQINIKDKTFVNREFSGRSSVLYTRFQVEGVVIEITDFMPLNVDFKGICRKISKAPTAMSGRIRLRSDYGLESVSLEQDGINRIKVMDDQWIHCSHPLIIESDTISYTIPEGAESWAAFINNSQFDFNALDAALNSTLDAWQQIEKHIDYKGPYEREVCNSLRALQQLLYEPTGGIVAAPTLGLPEVIGGKRNYDYRYVWMRDAALITSSLVGLKTDGNVERHFLSFIAGAMKKNQQSHASCFYGIDQSIRRDSRELPLSGYKQSQPVMAGNTAADQFQLDAESNILLACYAIYNKMDELIEWDVVEKIADFICRNWERKDNGIWEEEQLQHYTSSKALAARALEAMAEHQPNLETANRWRHNARLIREFINTRCLTSYGAYAVYEGAEDVDISCALFTPFGFENTDSPVMLKTIAAIEQNYAEGHLYRRNLLEFDSAKEGVFLAASCWMAHYYALAGNTCKSKNIIEAVLKFSNDLGYFSEEANVKTGEMLGNLPQTFVHSSFICAVNGYKLAMDKENCSLS